MPEFKTTPEPPSLDSELMLRVQQSWPLEAYEFTGDELTQVKKRLALQGYAMRGIISNACYIAGVARKTWHNWCVNDPEFAKAAAEGKEFAIETLEDRAFSRGHSMSDALLTFMLKHGKPQVFRDTIAHVGANGAPLPAALTNVNIGPVLILPDNHRGDAPVAPPEPALPAPEPTSDPK